MTDSFDPNADPNSLVLPDDAQFSQPDIPPEQLLKFGTPLHGKVVSRLNARVEMSHRNLVAKRQDDWDRADDSRRLYVNLARPARKGDKTEDVTKKEMPFERAIVMPGSYAAHEVRKTRMASQFLFRNPFQQFDGRGPEDMRAAKLAEAKLDYDFQESNGPLAIWSIVQDADAYGIGIIHDSWDEVHGWMTKRNPPPSAAQRIMASFGIGSVPPEMERVFGPIKQFTRWIPVDPYLAWRDPRVSAANCQDGEFMGHRSYRSFLWLLEREMTRGGPYFNLDQLKKNTGGAMTRTSSGAEAISTRSSNRITGNEFNLRGVDDKDKGFFVLDHLEVRLVPKEWELGPGDTPEIWWFTVSNESVIVRAHQSEYEHNQFCYGLAEVSPDAHQMANPGMVENLDGLQRMSDWLVNARIENIMKFLHDMFVFSPVHIEEDDINAPGPARWIRLTAEGQNAVMTGAVRLADLFQQLEIRDLTGEHVNMAQLLMDQMQKLSAAADQMSGQMSPEKRTLGEVQEVLQGAGERISMTARLIDAMAFAPLGMRAISNAQQFLDVEQFVKVTGDLAQYLSAEDGSSPLQRFLVNREQLQGNFDYVPHSSMSPTDPARQMAVWMAVWNSAIQAAAVPGVGIPDPRDGKSLDFRKLFAQIAQLGGARDIDSFFTNMVPMMTQGAPGVLPDEQVQAGVQAGNLVPITTPPGTGAV